MKTYVALALWLALSPAVYASITDNMCLLVNRHKDQLGQITERVAQMSVPKLDGSRSFTCRLVPGYGCMSPVQYALPVRIEAAGSGPTTADFTQGMPPTNRRAHLFYLHDRFTVSPEGALINARTQKPGGYVREDQGRLYALVTEAFLNKITFNDDPSLLYFGRGPERIIRAYVCVPDGWFE